MGIVRTAQPSMLSLPGIKVDLYGTATAYPIALSRDRKTVYGAASILETSSTTILYQSTDDGTTWSSVHTFAEKVVGIRETGDGEALVYTMNAAATPGYVYRSSGWATSHTTATWTKVLTTTGGYIRGYWSGGHTWSFGDDAIRSGTSAVGILNEYGSQTTSSGSQTAYATRAYATTDYGATWTVVLDLATRYPGVFPLHLHSSAYDPYWDRFWVTFGDNTNPEGSTKLFVAYSDDRGSTWSLIAKPSAWQTGNGPGLQATSIGVTRDHLYFAGDNGPGLYRIPRKGYRVSGDPEIFMDIQNNTGDAIIGMGLHQNIGQPTAPILAAYVSSSANAPAPILVSPDAGLTFSPAWEDTALRGPSAKGPVTVFGPTYNGKIVASVAQTSTVTWLLRGELVVPESGYFDDVLIVTGDGATTAFTYAHGLGIKPTRLLAWPERANPISSFSADTTNITVTFTTAPANAAVVPVQLRFAA